MIWIYTVCKTDISGSSRARVNVQLFELYAWCKAIFMLLIEHCAPDNNGILVENIFSVSP